MVTFPVKVSLEDPNHEVKAGRTDMATEITAGLKAGDLVAVPVPKPVNNSTGQRTGMQFGASLSGFGGEAGRGFAFRNVDGAK